MRLTLHKKPAHAVVTGGRRRLAGSGFAWFRVSFKCPCCQQYSLTYDWLRHGYICHVYNAFIPAERVPQCQ